jgi:hypothetical protein
MLKGYLFRATSGGVMRVSGLTQIQVPTIENVNVTELVPGHMVYRTAMPKLLREVGWEVEADEFTEIEDPDPENHEKRQRELINEIEEARKELEKKSARRKRKVVNLAGGSARRATRRSGRFMTNIVRNRSLSTRTLIQRKSRRIRSCLILTL